ncbi:MAG: WYL domain-containing protein [Bacteroidetes bacterium]|nr:WYL domain-containing protein [Bacteroidota bacterium]
MPQNKNAIIRYQTLDKCFRNPGRRYYFEDLLSECNQALSDYDPESTGIKRRQLFDDILFMESEKGWSIPLLKLKDGKQKYYRYEDMNFSINNSPINEMESEQIKAAMLILSRFKGAPQFAWIEEMIPKLQQTFGFKTNEKEIISFDSNQYLKGIEHLGAIFNAILFKKTLTIGYQSFKTDKPTITVISPYYLKQYNNRWYLFGKTVRFENLSIRSLDRIISVAESKEPYLPNTEVDFSEYFEDIIGITKPKDSLPLLIELWFSPKQAPYVLTKPLHGSQKKKSFDETGLIITIEVIPNYELKSLILSFGREAKVCSPAHFGDEILNMAYGNYL